MAKVTRSRPNAFAVLQARLKELDGKTAKAGWFSTSKYENGTPVAEIAAVQEMGAHFTRFGSKAGDYTVIIPPRPFMRPTIVRMSKKWMELLASGARAVLKGNSTGLEVMDAVGLNAQEEIKRSITQVFDPPLKPATIAARKRARADKKTTGSLDKPLEDTFTMYNSVQHTVESE
jgi:hypothetical protein